MRQVVEESGDENCPLNGETGKEEVEAERGPAVALQEGHEKAETDDNHDVSVLEPRVDARQFVVVGAFRASALDIGMIVGKEAEQDHECNLTDAKDKGELD